MPATVAVIDGVVRVGLSPAELDRLCLQDDVLKLSTRDLGVAVALGRTGATTVASTAALAHRAGIRVFATGGLGGVHRGAAETFDISADLGVLATTPVLVVCAGVKSILDVPATLERLETLSVPVLGYRTDRFPGFYLTDSGSTVPWRVESAAEAAAVVYARSLLGTDSAGVVLANPLPEARQVDPVLHDRLVASGLAELAREGVSGKDVTPRLLEFFHESSGGREPASQRRAGGRQRRPGRRGGGRAGRAARRRAGVSVRPVVVVGDVGLDVLVRPQAGVVRGGDTPSDVRIVPGGAGGNTAAWLASAGVPVALVSRVGDDDAGAAARRRLESDGVVCRFATDPVLPTCTVVVLLEDDERTMLPDRGANAALSRRRPRPGGRGGRLGHGWRGAAYRTCTSAGSCSWTRGRAPPGSRRWSRRGHSGGPRRSTRRRPTTSTGSARTSSWSWVEGVDLLLPNEIEAQALGGDEAMLGVATAAAVSMGAGGARWATRAHTWRVPAPEVVEGDRTGCGDAFDAGVLAAWLSGAGPEEALTRGVELGSRAAGRTGARP